MFDIINCVDSSVEFISPSREQTLNFHLMVKLKGNDELMNAPREVGGGILGWIDTKQILSLCLKKMGMLVS